MSDFVGTSVQNVTLKKQSDVVIKKVLATEAAVTIPDGTEGLKAGQVLITTDGGATFDVAAVDAEPNGILCDNLETSGPAEVLLLGVVREKYLEGLNASHKPHLFNNKIILR
ncbi:MAG: hypothetical protein C0625_02080 [Arcobacter sp.]|nr:MAG: hypothetical protein C0625_02080 [Arcobacter sp.]